MAIDHFTSKQMNSFVIKALMSDNHCSVDAKIIDLRESFWKTFLNLI